MSDKVVAITIELPEAVEARLRKVADSSGWSLEDVVLQCIRTGMPPSLAKVPADFHENLLILNKMSDQDLWKTIEGESEEKSTSPKAAKADLATLRRVYAFALLKWRGHPVPDPSELIL